MKLEEERSPDPEVGEETIPGPNGLPSQFRGQRLKTFNTVEVPGTVERGEGKALEFGSEGFSDPILGNPEKDSCKAPIRIGSRADLPEVPVSGQDADRDQIRCDEICLHDHSTLRRLDQKRP
jgi:hypothetical protein